MIIYSLLAPQRFSWNSSILLMDWRLRRWTRWASSLNSPTGARIRSTMRALRGRGGDGQQDGRAAHAPSSAVRCKELQEATFISPPVWPPLLSGLLRSYKEIRLCPCPRSPPTRLPRLYDISEALSLWVCFLTSSTWDWIRKHLRAFPAGIPLGLFLVAGSQSWFFFAMQVKTKQKNSAFWLHRKTMH